MIRKTPDSGLLKTVHQAQQVATYHVHRSVDKTTLYDLSLDREIMRDHLFS